MSMTTKRKNTTRKKSGASPAGEERTIALRLHELRKLAGVSQEAMGAQGFVSAPGWIKMENGQRSPSEKLLMAFVTWLVEEKVVRSNQKAALLDELCALKYASHGNAFVREMAREYLAALSPVALKSSASHPNEYTSRIHKRRDGDTTA
jgi:transcriptional regulator with XRE-family HTH domain